MQLCHAEVIAVKQRPEILGDVVQVLGRQAGNDTKIQGDVAGVFRVADIHQDVARMHVGVEQVVAENLGVKNTDTDPGQAVQVNAVITQALDVTDRNTGNPLHDQYRLTAIGPVYFGDVEFLRALEIAAQQGCIGRFPIHVQFIENKGFELPHEFRRPYALSCCGVFFGQVCDGVKQVDVAP